MKNGRRDFLKALGVLGVTSSQLMKLQNTLAASSGSVLVGCYVVTGAPPVLALVLAELAVARRPSRDRQGGNTMSGSVLGGQEIHRLFNVLSR